MKKLSREKIAEVLKLRESGFAYPQIIEQTGVCKSAVQKYCSILRPELRTIAYKRLPQECIDEVKRLRVRGLSLRKIERATGLSGPYIHKICVKYCPGFRNVGNNKIDHKKFEIIERHYKDGFTTKELAKMTGCHIATVQRYLKSKGVKLPLTVFRSGKDRKKTSVKVDNFSMI